MRPVIALVGRPNVGKSTLFNRLTSSRDAIVANIPGLTRDRQYGEGEYSGKSFIVGEKGPELFTPGRSGAITPNNKLGGGGSTSVVVNVDASGTDVQGDDSQAKELGTLISVAVQGELIKQQRPGGILYR